jgi:multiple sugar transport system substrate-binding protein
MSLTGCNRRTISLLLLTMVALTSCTSTPSASPPAAAPSGRAQGEISFSAFGSADEAAIFQAVVNGYKTVNPLVTVNLNVVPNENDFLTKLSASFAAGAPPDVFLVNYRRYGQFAARNVLEPVEGHLAASTRLKKDQFYETAMKAFTWNGVQQCIPQNLSSLVVYYNKDVFARYGVPFPRDEWTWADFLAAAKLLTQDTDGDGQIDLHGIAVDPSIIRAAPFVYQHGGRLVDNEDQPTRIVLDETRTREGLQFFIDLGAVHRVSPNSAEFKAEGPDSRFMTGKAAMTLNSRRIVPEFRTIKGFEWDVAGLPVDGESVSILHSDAYCIAASTSNKAAAWDFVEYATGVEGQQIAARLGRLVPSLKSVANSPVFLDPAQSPANSKLFLDVAPRLRVLPVLAEWPAIERILNEEVENAFFGNKSLEDAIITANRKSNDLLRQ